MGLEEFWGTTPGEVAVVIRAAAERQQDPLELGVDASFYGRAASYETDELDRKVFLDSLHRGKRKVPLETSTDFRRWLAGETTAAVLAIQRREADEAAKAGRA
jgi:hypothetical protein